MTPRSVARPLGTETGELRQYFVYGHVRQVATVVSIFHIITTGLKLMPFTQPADRLTASQPLSINVRWMIASTLAGLAIGGGLGVLGSNSPRANDHFFDRNYGSDHRRQCADRRAHLHSVDCPVRMQTVADCFRNDLCDRSRSEPDLPAWDRSRRLERLGQVAASRCLPCTPSYSGERGHCVAIARRVNLRIRCKLKHS